MTTYIALLRGINVGGKTPVKMGDLVEAINELNFKNVRTYVQSGNVVFQTAASSTIKLEETIKQKMLEAFGFEIAVRARSAQQFANLISANPFVKKFPGQPDKLHVTFLSKAPDKKTLAGLDMQKLNDEEFRIIGEEIFLYLPHGYGTTKLSNNAFEKKTGVPCHNEELENRKRGRRDVEYVGCAGYRASRFPRG